MAFSDDLVLLTEHSCHMLAAIKECQRFLDQKDLKSNVGKCGILKVLPVKGKRSMKVINLGTSMMVWTSIRLYHTAKVSWCLHSVWRGDCCTTCNMAGKTGIFNILLLDTYTKVHIYTGDQTDSINGEPLQQVSIINTSTVKNKVRRQCKEHFLNQNNGHFIVTTIK